MLPGWCCIAIAALEPGNGDSWYHTCALRFHFWGRESQLKSGFVCAGLLCMCSKMIPSNSAQSTPSFYSLVQPYLYLFAQGATARSQTRWMRKADEHELSSSLWRAVALIRIHAVHGNTLPVNSKLSRPNSPEALNQLSPTHLAIDGFPQDVYSMQSQSSRQSQRT